MVDATMDWPTRLEALRDWVRLSTGFGEGHVIWQYPDDPAPLRPFALVSILSGPRSTALPENRRDTQTMVERVTVAAVTAGEYLVRVYNADASQDAFEDTPTFEAGVIVDGTESIEEVRDALIEAIDDEDTALVLTPVTPAEDEDPDNAFDITGATGFRHFHLEVESPSNALTHATRTDALLETSFVPGELTVRVQVETDSQRPTLHARYWASRCEPALGLAWGPIPDALRDGGFAFRKAFGIIDLSGLMGAQNVSRTAQDFIFSVGSQISQAVPWIRRATHSGAIT
jgi:hypothetical protein